MPLFFVTVAREEFEFTVEAADEAQVRAACAKEDFDHWRTDPTWRVESVSPIKQECKRDIAVVDGKFGEWEGE